MHMGFIANYIPNSAIKKLSKYIYLEKSFYVKPINHSVDLLGNCLHGIQAIFFDNPSPIFA